MSRIDHVIPEFVEEVPRELSPGGLYISIAYGTAVHLCCCGCGNEVVTPLHPTRWALTYDGETVSLNPSVGSWSLPCQSHYVIKKNQVRWAARWSNDRIAAGRALEQSETAAHFSRVEPDATDRPVHESRSEVNGILGRLSRLLGR